MKIVNASPKFQQQLSDFLSVQTAPNSAITGNTISSSPGGQISQKGEYVNPNTNQTNLDGAKINLNLTASDIRDGWSLGYTAAETLAHELGHAFDIDLFQFTQSTSATDKVFGSTRSEARAEINSFTLMSDARSHLVASSSNLSAAGGSLFDSQKAATAYPAAESVLKLSSQGFASAEYANLLDNMTAAQLQEAEVTAVMGRATTLDPNKGKVSVGYDYFNWYNTKYNGTHPELTSFKIGDDGTHELIGGSSGSTHQWSLVDKLSRVTIKTWDVMVFDDGSTISTVKDSEAGTITTTTTNATTSATVKQTDTNHDGVADTILLITSQTSAQITQPAAITPPATAPSSDPLSNALDTVRNSLAAENDELVDSTELRTLTGAESARETWGGARLLEVSASSLADWYNTTSAWFVQGIEVNPVTELTGLNGFAVDFGTLNPIDYGGINLMSDFNLGNTTSFLIYGVGANTTYAIAPTYDYYYDFFLEPAYTPLTYTSTSPSYGFESWNDPISSFDYFVYSYTLSTPSYSYDWSASISTYDAFDWYEPLVLDLDGDGIELIKRQDSRAYYDVTGDGFRRNIGWVGPQDGLLAIDRNSDGKINLADELSFAMWTADPNDTDLGGLRAVFDTNHNGLLDAGDTRFADMRIWQDLNSDGVSDTGELKTLAQAGIVSISLTAAQTDWSSGGSHINGFTTYQKGNGTMGWAADAGLGYEADGWKSVDAGTFTKVTQSGGLNYAIAKGATLSADLGALALDGAVGSAAADVLNAATRQFAVLLEGGAGNDNLTGGLKDDWLNGGAGADTLSGGAGDDTLVIDASDLQTNLSGGAGFDIGMVSGTAAVTFDLAPGAFEAAVGGDGNDVLNTTGNWRVVLAGGKGADTLTGGSNRDLLTGGAGNDLLNGGADTDTAAFDGLRSSYVLTKGSGNYAIQGADGTDTLLNVERLHFSDLEVAMDATGTAGQNYRVFEGALGRAPDVGGMGFYMTQLDQGKTLVSVAAQLVTSSEFASKYGSNLTNSQYLTLLYNNALHRAPDVDGLAWWTNAMATDPNATRSSVLANFSESAECQALFVGVISNGVDYVL